MADFTEVYKQTGSLVVFSPNGEYIANAVNHRLVIRETSSLSILQLYNCQDSIQAIEFSGDSELVLVASYKLGVFQVFSVVDENWAGVVEEGSLGCRKVAWAPDGRHLLSFSNYEIRITVWSLITRESTYIQYPKFSNRGYSFRSDGEYFCVGERDDGKEFISIFDTKEWKLRKRFEIETQDFYELKWSPDGRFIAVWENIVDYEIFIYHPDGRMAGRYKAYEDFLGIKCVEWSPSSQLLSIGSFDEKIRLINHYTWNPIAELDHDREIQAVGSKFYREIDLNSLPNIQKTWTANRPRLQYEMESTPATVPIIKSDPERPNPKMGISFAGFSSNGEYIASFSDSQPLVIRIWDVASLELLCLIQQTEKISKIRWNPVIPNQLAFCCGNGLIYLWDRELGCDAIEVPAGKVILKKSILMYLISNGIRTADH